MGRYSAELGLRTELSIKKKYNPSELLENMNLILEWYYSDCETTLVEKNKKTGVLHITDFPNLQKIIEMRIGGGIEKAIEKAGGKSVKVKIKNH